MSVFDFEGGGSGNGWNYAHPDQENFYPSITGDVVAISSPQSINFATKKPEWWDEAQTQPKLNICLTIKSLQTGSELTWVFGPGGRQRPSNAMAAVRSALQAAGFEGKSVTEIGGMNITVSTPQPPQGFTYSQANPRPWSVKINGKATSEYRGVENNKLQQQAQPQRQQQQQQQAQQYPTMLQYQQQQAYNALQASGQFNKQTQQQMPYGGQVAPGEYAPTNLYGEDIPF